MGHRPPKSGGKPPTRETFHLGVAKEQYALGHLTLEELNEAIDHVLAGGTLTAIGRIPQHPIDYVLADAELVYARVTIEEFSPIDPRPVSEDDPGEIRHSQFVMPKMERRKT